MDEHVGGLTLEAAGGLVDEDAGVSQGAPAAVPAMMVSFIANGQRSSAERTAGRPDVRSGRRSCSTPMSPRRPAS